MYNLKAKSASTESIFQLQVWQQLHKQALYNDTTKSFFLMKSKFENDIYDTVNQEICMYVLFLNKTRG